MRNVKPNQCINPADRDLQTALFLNLLAYGFGRQTDQT